ncbi:MAG: hypothetical protein ACO248_11650 [Burkholderiaceae bacterium]
MNIPAQIRAGDTVTWRDEAARDVFGNPIGSGNGWTLTYYFRFNRNNHGATVVGTAYGQGWEFSLTAATTEGFHADDTGYWQAVATKAGETVTLGSGQFQIEANLAYVGTPAAFDNRSQAQKDLDAVQAAMRAIVSGGAVAEYTIGSRRLKKMEMADLIQLESKLKAEVKREQAATMVANGLGSPHNLFVRF